MTRCIHFVILIFSAFTRAMFSFDMSERELRTNSVEMTILACGERDDRRHRSMMNVSWNYDEFDGV